MTHLHCAVCGLPVGACDCQVDKYILLVQDLDTKQWIIQAQSPYREIVQKEYDNINKAGDTGPKLIIFTGDYATL